MQIDLLLQARTEIHERSKAYNMIFLLEVVSLSGMLAKVPNIHAVVAKVAGLFCQDSVAGVLGKHLEQRWAMPRRSTIYRHRLTLHVGWMLHLRSELRQFHCSDFMVYRTMDASPQGGREWLLTAYTYVRRADLLRFMDATHKLSMLRGMGLHDKELTAQEQEEEVRLLSTFSSLRLQRGVPVCTGSGRGSVAHKVHAALHADRLIGDSWGGSVPRSRADS